MPHLRRAIAVLGEDGDRVALGGLWAELSESLWMAGLGDEASAASDRSVEVLGNSTSRERAEALGWRSRLSMLLGRYRDAIPPGTEAVGLARTINASRELSRALNALGTSLAMVGNQQGLFMLREAFAMIDDPIAYYVVPLTARVEATGALLAHDPGAPGRISRLVDLLRTVHDSVVPADTWPGTSEPGCVSPRLSCREPKTTRRRGSGARHCCGSARSLTQSMSSMRRCGLPRRSRQLGNTANAEAELAPAYERARSIGAVPLVAEMEAIARRARLKLSAMPQVGLTANVGSPAVSVKCSSWCRKAGRIVRSVSPYSSARRPPASMYPTSWPSLERRTEQRPARRRGHWDWTDSSAAHSVCANPVTIGSLSPYPEPALGGVTDMAESQATPQPAADPGNTLGIVGLILAIIPCTSTIGMVLSIVAYIISRRASFQNSKALAGIIIGAAWLVLGFILQITMGLISGIFQMGN